MTYPLDADRLLATLRDGAWLDAQEFPPLAYAVPGLIPEGSVLLVGAPKIGKSWLVLAVGLAASDGGKCPRTPSHVVRRTASRVGRLRASCSVGSS
jgi:hypothetical protein